MPAATISPFPALGAPTRARAARGRARLAVVSKAGDANELGPAAPPRTLMHFDKDGKPSIVPTDVPPLQSAAVGLGGAVCIFGFALWRIESNKKKELAYWKEQNRQRKEKEARETKEEADSEPASDV
jgi:hypothetical protein